MTQRGLKLLHDYAFQGVTVPTNFYLALVTAATAPAWATTTLGGLTEIAAGNGYTSGGFQLTPNTTDFDVQVLSSDPDFVDQQIKNVNWNASGGTIPGSGDGASSVVLTTDEGTVADRQVLAYYDLNAAPVTVPSGLTLTLIDAFSRLGGDLATTPTDSESSGSKTLTADSSAGVKGAYTEIFASTSRKSTEIFIRIFDASAISNLLIDLSLGAASSEVVKIADLSVRGSNITDAGGDKSEIMFAFEVPSGSRVAMRVESETGGSDTVRTDVTLAGRT